MEVSTRPLIETPLKEPSGAEHKGPREGLAALCSALVVLPRRGTELFYLLSEIEKGRRSGRGLSHKFP